jgi:ADP-heptose:LPS heptosyltransferase
VSRRILVMQLARLGDLVQTWPLLHDLRQTYPQARLGLLMDESWRHLARFGPPLDELHTLAPEKTARLACRRPDAAYQALSRLVADLQSRNFDVVYNLNFSRLSLLAAHLIKAPVNGYRPAAGGREFWREPWLAFIYGLVHARVFNRVHLSDVFRHLALPAEMTPVPPAPPPSLPREPIIALQLATRHPKRTWPLPFFARLAYVLIQRLGVRLWLLGSAGERPLGERLLRSLPPRFRERLDNLQGRTGLGELAERLQAADLLISGDTGTLHLAAALGTRVAAIFLGPALCFETGPYGFGHITIQAEPLCHPCAEAGPDCDEPVCRSMIAPELAAEVVCAMWGLKDSSAGLHPPAGVRVYQSVMDRFGADYAIRAGKPPGWADLLGRAYRAAGARLLGRPFLPSPLSTPELPATGLGVLENLVGALRNGATASHEPAVTQALTPLWAFQEAMQQQESRQAGEPAALDRFQALKAALAEELENLFTGK